MKNFKNKFVNYCISVFIIILICSGLLMAQSDGGRTAADFLTIGAGARAASMGGAYTAVADGAFSSFWNPAGLTSINKSEINLGHFDWYQDITFEQGAVAFKANDKMTVSLSFLYLNYGEITRYDNTGTITGEIDVYDWSGGIALGYRVSEVWSVGLAGKYINQKIDDISGSAFAVDIGAKYFSDRFTLGAVIVNLGPKMKFENISEKLPAASRFGITYTTKNNMLLSSVEIEKPFYGNLSIKEGNEFRFEDKYFLRAGFTYITGLSDYSITDGLSFGAGALYNWLEIDYSFSPSEKYSSESIHRFTLIMKLGN